MRLQWPEALLLLLVLPVAAWALRRLARRRSLSALRFGSLAIARSAVAPSASWRRRVPPILLGLGLVCSIVAISRPVSVLWLPSIDKTVILAMDVSASMRAKDVSPDRITVARDAVREFIVGLPTTTKVGLVTFAATAAVAQAPTVERDDLLAAVEKLQLQRGTATGSAILISLQSIFPELKFNLQTDNPRPRDDKGAVIKPDPAKVKAPGSHTSAAIILISDGQRNFGPDPIEAARIAAEHGVKVFTVGLGTPAGEVLASEGWSMRVKLDEAALKQIANLTGGTYSAAATAQELRQAYEALSLRVVMERRESEVSAAFLLAGALLIALGAGLSVAWYGRWAPGPSRPTPAATQPRSGG